MADDFLSETASHHASHHWMHDVEQHRKARYQKLTARHANEVARPTIGIFSSAVTVADCLSEAWQSAKHLDSSKGWITSSSYCTLLRRIHACRVPSNKKV